MRPWKPFLMSMGTRPEWSMWAWVTSTASMLAAAKGMELPVVELTAENVREQRKQIEFDAAFGGERLKGLAVSLCGRHQADNAKGNGYNNKQCNK